MSKIEKKTMTFVLTSEPGNKLIGKLMDAMAEGDTFDGVTVTAAAIGDDIFRLEELDEDYGL